MQHLLLVVFLFATPILVASEELFEKKRLPARLRVEYGIDSLERRYYHPQFKFFFPFRKGAFFLEVEYHSRLNSRLQGAIDYWINTGVDLDLNQKTALQFSLNHFCRHQTGRKIFYVWNFNELLSKIIFKLSDGRFYLGVGTYLGGSDVYRQLITTGIEKRGLIFPEMKIETDFKLVNFTRLYYNFYLAVELTRFLEIFYRRTKDYELEPLSYIGFRFNSCSEGKNRLRFLKVVPGFLFIDKEHKLELDGYFRFDLFNEQQRQLLFSVNFNLPVFAGRNFWGEFNPDRMRYAITLEYEKTMSRSCYVSWISIYRLEQPVDLDLPFAASLFSGFSLKNQSNFDLIGKDFRYNLTAGYDFKKGLTFFGKAALKMIQLGKWFLQTEAAIEIDRFQKNLDFWLVVNKTTRPEIRPFIRWRKDFSVRAKTDLDFLVGIGFFVPGRS